jgi:uncharacterized membrane protein
MDSEKLRQARRELIQLLTPCFATPPTAGFVLLVNSAKGTRFYSMNLNEFEAVETLVSGGAHLGEALGMGDTGTDRVMQ